jgi:hypothetical protein
MRSVADLLASTQCLVTSSLRKPPALVFSRYQDVALILGTLHSNLRWVFSYLLKYVAFRLLFLGRSANFVNFLKRPLQLHSVSAFIFVSG